VGRVPLRALPLFVAFGCGGSPRTAPATALDGGPEANADAGPGDAGSCFPFCGNAGDAGGATEAGAAMDAAADAAVSCATLLAHLETLQAQAQSCNPQLQDDCSATTDGPCCPVTVSTADRGAVDDFDQAVAAYTSACTPDCARVICQPAPSNRCDPLALGTTLGRCE
jgi:hypothetical protein